MDDPVTRRIRELISALGMTVDEFARRLGEKPQRIKDVLRGKTRPSVELILAVTVEFLVEPEWILAGVGEIFGNRELYLASSRQGNANCKTEEAFISIPYYDARASAGIGLGNVGVATAESGMTVKHNQFRREWWQRSVGVPPERCFSMEIIGDSMAPRLTESHVPIIERIDNNEMFGDGIYVFRIGDDVFIKCLVRRPGGALLAKSHNEHYPPWEITADSGEFKIIGRVIRKMIVESP